MGINNWARLYQQFILGVFERNLAGHPSCRVRGQDESPRYLHGCDGSCLIERPLPWRGGQLGSPHGVDHDRLYNRSDEEQTCSGPFKKASEFGAGRNKEPPAPQNHLSPHSCHKPTPCPPRRPRLIHFSVEKARLDAPIRSQRTTRFQ